MLGAGEEVADATFEHIGDDFVRRAAEQADQNALRTALFQQTGDPELAGMQPVRREVRGGGMTVLTIDRTDRPKLTEKLLSFARSGQPPSKCPSVDQLRNLLEVFGAPAREPLDLAQAREDLAFDPPSGDAQWENSTPSAAVLADWTVAIVGCGISGLAAAVRLKRLGLQFTIYDRQDRIGGTWARNVYPEARVDIPNSIYQFKFERDHQWVDHFSTQAELQAYLEAVAERHGLAEHLELGVEVEGGDWDEQSATWSLRLRSGPAVRTATARVVLSASGLFGTAKNPNIEGLGRFRGPIIHTTSWRDTLLDGQRVALIGTGSSGAQLMPHLARKADRLDIYQRTPNWVLPMTGYHASRTPEQNWLAAALPAYWHWQNYAALLLDREIEHLQEEDSSWQQAGGQVSRRNDALRAYLTAHVHKRLEGRPDLIAASVPAYPPAARRMVVDNGWYDALLRPNVSLIGSAIDEIEDDAIRTVDGRLRQTDVIVLGTGFETDRYLWPAGYVGRSGATPEVLWRGGARAHLGMTLPGLPNFVMMYGPHGQPRSGAFHDWADRWARYAVRLIVATIQSGGTSFMVRREAFDAYNAKVDEAGGHLIWGKRGAGSYYLDPKGRPAVNMPWKAKDYSALIREPDLAEYEIL